MLNLLLALVAIFVVPPVGAKFLTKVWRMPNFFWRFTWSLFALMFGLTMLVGSWAEDWKNVKLGIDLRGGTILVYEVKGTGSEGITQEDEGTASPASVNMEELTVALRKRVDPDSVKDVTIRALGENQVEIIIPEVSEDEVAALKRKIASVGTLEFRITANARDHADIIEIAKQTPGRVVRSADNSEVLGWWVPVAVESDTEWEAGGYISRHAKEEGKDIVEVLCVNDDFNVQGGYLESASAAHDGFNPIVEFKFNPMGANLFRGLTSANQPIKNPQNPANDHFRQLGIILDGAIQSAPRLQSVISDRGQISGGFTPEKTQELAGVLKAGRLPAVLGKIPSSEMTTGPTLGTDTIYRASNAILISVLLVMLIMVFYYRFSGWVAVICLFMLMLLTFGIMVGIHSAFTLPGLAGLVLTVGMAVDANILIYERMREEWDAGSTISNCVRNGFGKAFSAIVDSNITTLLVATILFWIGTEQIRGFAIILWIGIVISMFCAIYIGRTVFEVAIQRGWLTEIRMRRVFPPTNIPFMNYTKITLCISGVLCVLCLTAVFSRANGWANATSIFDIDFSGGDTVQVLFKDAQTESGIYEKLSDVLEDLTVTDVTLTTDEAKGLLNRRYNITATSPKGVEASEYLIQIQKLLQERFPNQLKTNKMSFEVAANVVANAVEAKPLEESLPAAPVTEPAPVAPTPAPAAETPAPVAPAAPAPAEAPKPADGALNVPVRPMEQLMVLNLFGQTEEVKPAAEPAPAPAPAAEPGATPAPAVEPAPAPAPAAEPAATPAPAVEPAPAPAPAVEPAPAPVVEPAATPAPAVEPAPAPAPAAEPAATPAPVTEEVKPTEPVALPEQPVESGVADLPTDVDLSAKQTTVKINFDEAVNHEMVASLISERLAAMEKLNVVFELKAPEAEAGTRRFNDWTVQIDLPAAEATEVFAAVQESVNTTPVFPSCTTVGSQVAGSTCVQGLIALFASFLGIIAYIWIRFQKVSFGLASTSALVHDVLMALGLLAASTWLASCLGFLMITDFKISLTVLAAFLTLIGYSLNDTIVVFDRIREVRGKNPQLTKSMINYSLNQTLARTVMTSLTTFIVSLALYIRGGETIHGFAFVMTVGIIVGTYSSIFVAAPILYWMIGNHGDDK